MASTRTNRVQKHCEKIYRSRGVIYLLLNKLFIVQLFPHVANFLIQIALNLGIDSLSTESLNELFIALTVAQASRTGVSITNFVYIRSDVCFVE